MDNIINFQGKKLNQKDIEATAVFINSHYGKPPLILENQKNFNDLVFKLHDEGKINLFDYLDY